MKKRKNWTMAWVSYIHGKGHVYTEYRDGRVIYLAGVLVAKEAK